MSFTSAPAAARRDFTSSITANLRSSAQGKRSSGVLTTGGSVSRNWASVRSEWPSTSISRIAA